ncbi:phage regulatory protein/antirepressor Ant [Arthrobacter sp. MYb213]|uniref:Rha family transcriptional regulator n=1 Tax=Arthrobacter sp. MYb213 TaxID=1848595 RepID=UPI000CFD6D89|nr:phage regulatory protein/antirepressor Ant [Arthrobacter sp. MYb213]PRB69498.1 hypothetical protein CQ011_12105 [Arthrobacter sp. MYb213]
MDNALETRRPVIESRGSGLAVTSETIAQGAGIEHRAVLQLLKTHTNGIERFGRVAFEVRTFETAGGPQSKNVALLNEPQATLIMTFMKNTAQVVNFKVALVQAFYEMAEQLTDQRSPMSEDDIVAQALQITSARVKALESKVEQDAPKVDYVDTFVADEDLISLRTLASDLKIGETQLRALLVDKKWIYKQESSRYSEKKGRTVPVYRYSATADKKKYFHAVLAHDAPRFKGEVMHTLKATAQGAVAITRLLNGLRRDMHSIQLAKGPTS